MGPSPRAVGDEAVCKTLQKPHGSSAPGGLYFRKFWWVLQTTPKIPLRRLWISLDVTFLFRWSFAISQNHWFSLILVGKPLWFSSFGIMFWSAWRSKLFCNLRFRCLISWFRLLITKCPLLPVVWICWVRCYFFIDSVDLETFNRDASSYPFSFRPMIWSDYWKVIIARMPWL